MVATDKVAPLPLLAVIEKLVAALLFYPPLYITKILLHVLHTERISNVPRSPVGRGAVRRATQWLERLIAPEGTLQYNDGEDVAC